MHNIAFLFLYDFVSLFCFLSSYTAGIISLKVVNHLLIHLSTSP